MRKDCSGTTININAFRRSRRIVYSRRRRRGYVQQYRSCVSVSDTLPPSPLSLSLFLSPLFAHRDRPATGTERFCPDRAEYSSRPINKTQRRKAKQPTSRRRRFPSPLVFTSLFLCRGSPLLPPPPLLRGDLRGGTLEPPCIVARFPPVLRNTCRQ